MTRLVLNFDINKTIIMSDIGAGLDIFDILNSLLSECVWGVFDGGLPLEARKPADWKICLNTPYAHPPVDGAVTFGAYLEYHTTTPKKERVAIKTKFTNPGCIGEVFREYLLKIQSAMLVPNLSSGIVSSSEYYHILPSFFELVKYLVQNNVDFRIVFRTFGVDVPSIAKEFNQFCEGKHPLFPLLFAIDGSLAAYPLDRRLHLPMGSGKLNWIKEGSKGVQLAHVSNSQVRGICAFSLFAKHCRLFKLP